MLVTALLVRNEADRYLERVLRRCAEFSDEVIIVDDGSTDGSVDLARRLGCGVKRREEGKMWGNEAPARAQLWEWGARVAGDGWLLICDADMLLYGDPRPLTKTTQANSWAFILYDVWNEERYYRQDGYWQGHRYPRPWMFRPSRLDYDVPEWPARGIHTGHCPSNAVLRTCVAPPSMYYYCHLAYMRPAHRLEKHQRYMEQAHQLTSFERGHADSILD